MKYSYIALSVALMLASQVAAANPSGAQVVHGSASFSSPNANVLDITNSHNAIIQWQQFNIGAGQTTNFHQPSAASAVLNRVTGNNPSQILGNLNSNGKVFVINQHGLLVGEGAHINTAGFFASTLNITDADFLNGKLKFGGGGAGGINNQGYIHASEDGNVVLIAPNIENGGVIEVDNGNIILAAGESITITNLQNSAIEYQVSSPENSITNLGQIIANRGAASLFAGSLKHSGSIRATGLVQDADGTIRLVASDLNEVSGELDVSAEQGGRIEILGDVVDVQAGANVNASGEQGGGEILVGGDQQGLNPDVPNAVSTTIASGARVNADAGNSGKGGRVIVFAENDVHVHGEVTAKGGVNGGDGGFIETSGLQQLDITSVPDASAPAGKPGEWLIDPNNITLFNGTGVNIISSINLGSEDFTTTGNGALLDVALIESALLAGNDVTVSTGTAGLNNEDGDIFIFTSINASHTGTANLTFNAHDQIFIDTQSSGALNISSSIGVLNLTLNADIDNNGTGDITFFTGTGNSFPITIDTNGGTFTTNTDVNIDGDAINRSSFVAINNSQWTIPLDSAVFVNENLNLNLLGTTIQLDGEIDILNPAILDLGGDTLNIRPGGSLSGSGAVTGNVNVNGGAIFGGTGFESFGTLTINGNLNFNSGLWFSVIGVGDGLQASSIFTTTASITGGTLMVVWDSAISAGDTGSILDGTNVQLFNCIGTGCLNNDALVTGVGLGAFDTMINPIRVLTGTPDLNTTSLNALTYTLTDVVETPNVISWIAGTGAASWSDPQNWSPGGTGAGGIPGLTDFVFIEDANGTAFVRVDVPVGSIAGLQSFEQIQFLPLGDLTITGDGFILDRESPDDGILSFNGLTARLGGSGVLYTGPHAGLDLVSGNIAKDMVNWGGIKTTAGNTIQLESNLVNQSLMLLDPAAGASTFSGTLGTISSNGVISFGNGAQLSLVDNIALTVTSANASFVGAGVFTLDNNAVFDVLNSPAVYDSTIALEILGGAFTSADNLTILPDVIDWHSGVISGAGGADFTLSAGQVMTLFGVGDMLFDGGMNLDNSGIVDFRSVGGDFILNGSLLNNGQFLLNHTSDAADLTIPVSGFSALDNFGGVVQMNSFSDINVAWDISQNGALDIANGIFIVEGFMDVAGSTVDVASGAELNIAPGALVTMGSASDFTGDGSGQLTIDSGGVLDLDLSGKDLSVFAALNVFGGAIQNIENASLPGNIFIDGSGVFEGVGNLLIPAGALVTAGDFTFAGLDSINTLTVNNEGSIDIQAGQTLSLAFADLLNNTTGTLSGAGTLLLPLNTSLISNNTVSVANMSLSGGTVNANNMTYSGALSWLSGLVTGSGLTTTGSVSVTNGILSGNWTLTPTSTVQTLPGGRLDLQTGIITIPAGGRLSAGGELLLQSTFGGFSGGGQLDIVGGPASTASLNLNGNLLDLSTLQSLNILSGRIQDIQGLTMPATMNVSGNSTFAGVGTFQIPAGSTMNVPGSLLLESGLLIMDSIGNLTGAGTIAISTGTQLNANGAIDIASIFLSGGTLVANGLTYAGNLDWVSGTVSGTGLTTTGVVDLVSGTLATDWNLTGTSSDVDMVAGGRLNLQSGIIDIGAGSSFGTAGELFVETGFGGITGGQLDMTGSSALLNLNGNTLNLSSLQTLNINGGAVQDIQGLSMPATMNVSANSAFSGIGSGTFQIPSTSTLNVAGDLFIPNGLSIDSIGNLTGVGSITVSTGSQLTASSAVDIATLVLDGGTLTSNGLTFAGTLDWISGTVNGSGLTTTGVVDLVSGALATDWTIAPSGIVNWKGTNDDLLTIANATITNQGQFNIESSVFGVNLIGTTTDTIQIGQKSITAAKDFFGSTEARFVNQGLLVIDSDPVVGAPDSVNFDPEFISFNNDGGTIAILSGSLSLGGQDLVLDQATDTLLGSGTFVGNVINRAGVVTPGGNDSLVDTLLIDGNYTQQLGGTLVIDFGLDSGSSSLIHDTLDVTGILTAGGDLRFRSINGSLSQENRLLLNQRFNAFALKPFEGQFRAPSSDRFSFRLNNDGFVTVTADNIVLNRSASDLQALFDKEDLSYRDMVRIMRFRDQRLTLALNDEDEDEVRRAPRLVCK